MANPGYSLERQDGYVVLHFTKVLTHADFDRMVSDFLALVMQYKDKRFLFITDIYFADVDPARRMEGMRVAENFSRFERIAVVATDPQERQYLESSNSLLILQGIVKEGTIRTFAAVGPARDWLLAA
ncbi:MAG: hypothetical protein K0S68_605 [Candidatus Saccharibacteria bacterium]|jgi:hypothetical protein|nr:hypothetical protein [Candidatus Saccharibacteria bacterium]